MESMRNCAKSPRTASLNTTNTALLRNTRRRVEAAAAAAGGQRRRWPGEEFAAQQLWCYQQPSGGSTRAGAARCTITANTTDIRFSVFETHAGDAYSSSSSGGGSAAGLAAALEASATALLYGGGGCAKLSTKYDITAAVAGKLG